MRTVELESMAGEHIERAIDKAISKAKEVGCLVHTVFNDVHVTVAADSDPKLIYRDWDRAMQGYIAKKVGPYPAATLTADELASDAKIEAANEQRRMERQAEWQEQEAADKAAKAAILADAPPMERDEAKWAEGIAAQGGDGYGVAIYEFAQDWARLMQKRIAAGEKIPDIAEDCCSVADKGIGITGFMYGAAVAVLSLHWKHGEELRRWHNGQYGKPDIPGVVNPAILTINTDAA